MISKLYCLLRNLPAYPISEVIAGAKAVGVEVICKSPPTDVTDFTDSAILVWNNYGRFARYADIVKCGGGLHLSLENGYTNAFRTEKTYAVSNGAHHYIDQKWVEKNIARTGAAIDLSFLPITPPRRRGDGPYLVCGQRGGNYSNMSMPNDWPDTILTKIRQVTERDIIYKPHRARARVPQGQYKNVIIADKRGSTIAMLSTAYAVIVFTSNVSTDAIIRGVPVVYCGPRVPLFNLCSNDLTDLKMFNKSTRLRMLRLAVASEFTRSQIAVGDMFNFAGVGCT